MHSYMQSKLQAHTHTHTQVEGPHLSLTNLSVKYSREDHKHMLRGHGPLHWHITVLCKCSQMPLVHKVPLVPMQITFLHYLTWGMQSQQRIPCGGPTGVLEGKDLSAKWRFIQVHLNYSTASARRDYKLKNGWYVHWTPGSSPISPRTL